MAGVRRPLPLRSSHGTTHPTRTDRTAAPTHRGGTRHDHRQNGIITNIAERQAISVTPLQGTYPGPSSPDGSTFKNHCQRKRYLAEQPLHSRPRPAMPGHHAAPPRSSSGTGPEKCLLTGQNHGFDSPHSPSSEILFHTMHTLTIVRHPGAEKRSRSRGHRDDADSSSASSNAPLIRSLRPYAGTLRVSAGALGLACKSGGRRSAHPR